MCTGKWKDPAVGFPHHVHDNLIFKIIPNIQGKQIFMNDYKLATYFCRTSYAKEGVCMYVHKSLNIESVDIENYCNEKDLEACATKLTLNSTHICIITIYRAPSGNFSFFYK